MRLLAGRGSTLVLISFIPTRQAAILPSVRIFILRLEGLLGQSHLLIEGKIEKLQCQTKDIGMFEGQWRID